MMEAETDLPWEDDPENPNFLKNPAKIAEFEAVFGAWRMERFAHLIPSSVPDRLGSIGVTYTRWHNIALSSILAYVEAGAVANFSADRLKKERRIAELVTALKEELADEVIDESSVRLYWGDYVDPEDPEPQDYLYLESFQRDLDLLQSIAGEQIEWLTSAKSSPFEPGSNRADRYRHVYWLTILGFWKFVMHKPVATSSDQEGQANGPLIRFFQAMTLGYDEQPNAIREWVRRNEQKVEEIREVFEPFMPRATLDADKNS